MFILFGVNYVRPGFHESCHCIGCHFGLTSNKLPTAILSNASCKNVCGVLTMPNTLIEHRETCLPNTPAQRYGPQEVNEQPASAIRFPAGEECNGPQSEDHVWISVANAKEYKKNRAVNFCIYLWQNHSWSNRTENSEFIMNKYIVSKQSKMKNEPINQEEMWVKK